MTAPQIPLCRVFFDQAEEESVLDALRSGWLAHGPYNKKLEQGIAGLVGAKHAISMNSCTSALYLAVLLNEIKGEVILPSFTFVASANAVVTAGATVCLADIDEATGNLDPAAVEAKITPRTEALMVVHWAGQPAQMDRLSEIARKHDLLLIEDSAETLNATFDGRQAGSFGIGCFSFFPTKNITTGEGGLITTSDDAFAAKCRAFIGHGLVKDTHLRAEEARPWYRDARFAGYNFRLSNVLAAIGAAQVPKIGEITRRRQEAARLYDRALAPLVARGLLATPAVHPRATHCYQMYTVQLQGSSSARRDEVVSALNAQGIGASVHFDPPVHQQTYYREYFASRPRHLAADLPRTDAVSGRVITLPMYPALTGDDVGRVAHALAVALG